MSLKLGNTDIITAMYNNAVVERMYFNGQILFENTPVASNIILNSTFDDGSNITIESGAYDITNATLNFLDTEDNRATIFNTSEPITAGDYELGYDLVSSGGNARVEVVVNGNYVVNATGLSVGTGQTLSFTYSGADFSQIEILGVSSGGGTIWSMDNVTLIKTN